MILLQGKRRWTAVLLGFCLLLVMTRAWPRTWNDQSRLAAAWALSEHHGLAIDAPDNLFGQKTKDKALINGRFYSDKPPVMAFLAGAAAAILKTFGLGFSDHPRLTTYLLTWLFVGLPWLVYLGLLLRSIDDLKLHLVALLGTLALPYAFIFNNHLLAGCLLGIFLLRRLEPRPGLKAALVDGLLCGLAVVIDLAAILVGGLVVLWALVCRGQGLKDRLAFAAAGLLPVALHAALNLSLTGDLRQPSMHPEFMIFPGSVFTEQNLTAVGGLAWRDWSAWLGYLWSLTFGSKGFLTHNPLVLVGLVGLVWILARPWPSGPWFDLPPGQNRFLAAGIALGFLALTANYSLLSNNYGGANYSVRWFVIAIPLLLPYALSVLISVRGPWRWLAWGAAWLSAVLVLAAWPDPWLDHRLPPLDLVTGLKRWASLTFPGHWW